METHRPKCGPVVVVTYLTSPYQVEFFNAIQGSGTCDLSIVYLYSRAANRGWSARPLTHPHLVLDNDSDRFDEASLLVRNAELVVFNFYDHPFARRLMGQRHRSGKPWCFWGERPGYKNSGWMGRAYRRWKLTPLRESNAAIWGIGTAAVETYKKEFWSARSFARLPYYSDLSRFHGRQRSARVDPGFTTFLFSGSLIRRKGVDLLARAFLRLLAEGLPVKLKLLGSGELHRELTRQFKTSGDAVELLGFKDWDELPRVYRQADVLCVPSRYDGWGLVVPEGLAAGLPVIATDQTGAARDLIQHRDNGWLIKGNDSAALYAAMRSAALLSDAEYTRMSGAALASIVHHGLAQGVVSFYSACQSILQEWGVR